MRSTAPWYLDTMVQWIHGFTKSLGLILCSEVGDKTFIIAALMAMKHSRRMVPGWRHAHTLPLHTHTIRCLPEHFLPLHS